MDVGELNLQLLTPFSANPDRSSTMKPTSLGVMRHDVHNDGLGHRLQEFERYFAFPVIELSVDSERPFPRIDASWYRSNTGVSFQRPSQMSLSEHDYVIEAFSANAANKPFREWILPRTSRGAEHLSDSHSVNPVSEMATVNSITVSNQISRCRIVWKRFNDLLRRPFCRGMLSHIEMQDAAPLVRQHNENE